MSKQGGCLKFFGVFYLILCLFWPRFFYFSMEVKANENVVFVNEIAWMGSEININDEWIELYNNTEKKIDLNGWRLISRDGTPDIQLIGTIDANGYFLLERTDDDTVPEISADQIYSGALGNDGEFLELFNNNGELIDYIDASEQWMAGHNINKQTLLRNSEGVYLNSLNAGGTPKAENDIGEDVEENIEEEENVDFENNEDEEVAEEETQLDNQTSFKKGAVLINEVVSDPSEGDEWVELLNISGEIIDLKNWTIEEGSGAKTVFSVVMEANGEKSFFVIEKPKGNLNNSGDIIILRDENGVLVDSLAYGDWNDGNVADNATSPGDPYSLARYEKGKNSSNNNQDFALTKTLSKGYENIIDIPLQSGEANENTASNKKESIIISEIFPNPKSEEAKNEFIELYNAGEEAVELLEWQIGSEKENRYRIKSSVVIKPGEFFLLFRSETKIILNNNGGEIYLYKRDRKSAVDKLKYDKAEEGKSLNCLDDELFVLGDLANLDCLWSEQPSPGKASKIQIANRAPIPDFSVDEELYERTPIIFDSSDTYDSDDDTLEYTWEFGDGFKSKNIIPDHTFSKAGDFEVSLKVFDGELEAKIIKKIKIMELSKESISADNFGEPLTWKNLMIDKVLPNPIGADNDGEWIQIKNNGNTPLDLLNWQVDDDDGGSRPFTFKDSVHLSSNDVYLLSREDSGLALNNDGDAVRLIAPDKSIVQKIEYGKSSEGNIYGRGDKDQWTWFSVQENDGDRVLSEKKTSTAKIKISEAKNYKEIKIEEISEANIGESLRVEGKVSVLPGIFGSQYFYIYNKAGLQIYSYNKDYPGLKIGDIVRVSGDLSLASGELRLKTKTKENIEILKNESDIEFKDCTCAGLDDEAIGTPIALKGEIVKKQSGVIFLDDGSGETKLYIKPSTGIILDKFSVGKRIAVKGILTNSTSGRRVMPRSESDIVSEDLLDQIETDGRVLGETIDVDEWEVGGSDKKKEVFIYSLMIALAGTILVGIFIFRKKDSQKN